MTARPVQQLQDELEQLREQVTRYRRDSELLQQVLASRSWRWTRPLRLLLRVIRYGGLNAEDRERLAGFARSPSTSH